ISYRKNVAKGCKTLHPAGFLAAPTAPATSRAPPIPARRRTIPRRHPSHPEAEPDNQPVARRIHVRQVFTGELRLGAGEAHHVRDVLRMAVGTPVEVFDDGGN